MAIGAREKLPIAFLVSLGTHKRKRVDMTCQTETETCRDYIPGDLGKPGNVPVGKNDETPQVTTTTTVVVSEPESIPTTTVLVQCTEDMDCWDCHTQGNQVCGAVETKTVTLIPASVVDRQLAETGTDSALLTMVGMLAIGIGIMFKKLGR